MILDKLGNENRYFPLNPHVETAFAFLSTLTEVPPGRYEFSGGFALVQEGTTKPQEEGRFETHEKFLDIQVMLEGGEWMEWADASDLPLMVPYNAEKDIAWYGGSTAPIAINPNMFYIVFPEDAHKPCLQGSIPNVYRKVVLKCRLE